MSNPEKAEVEGERQQEQELQVKRPMNAFMLWSKEKRRKISSVDPSLHNSRISKILGEEWKRLPTREKDPYIKQSKMLMEKHKKDHPDYHYKPRQNKLTKALKELSSLRSSLATTSGLASHIKSLATGSTLPRYPAHFVLPRSRSSVLPEDLPFQYPTAHCTRAVPFIGCTCCLKYAESIRPHYHYRSDMRDSYREVKFIGDDRPFSMHGVWRMNGVSSSRFGWSTSSHNSLTADEDNEHAPREINLDESSESEVEVEEEKEASA